MRKKRNVKSLVREKYGTIASTGRSCCCASASCCGSDSASISKRIGYSETDINAVPQGANLGLGCGNPVALASLRKGETVLDLGSGAGFDAFLAAKKVGAGGKVIGVDMTEEMIDRARANAKKGGYRNVVFRLGEIENLPVENNSIDVIISNCVINLSPEKLKVFKEALRVLRPGGRLMVSDLVLLKRLPARIKESVEAYIGCVAGASLKTDYMGYIKKAGFEKIEIVAESAYDDAGENKGYVASILVRAIKNRGRAA